MRSTTATRPGSSPRIGRSVWPVERRRRRPRARAARPGAASRRAPRAAAWPPRTRAGRGGTTRRPAGRRGRTRCGASAQRGRGRRRPASSAPRSTSSIGSGEPRSCSDSSTTRSGDWMARPRRRPSTKSTAWRGTPENGDRRYVKRSPRVPPSHAKRSIDASAWPNGVCVSRSSPSMAYGTPRVHERRLERSAHALDARADDADAFRRRARAKKREQLLADELERAARARAFEEADGTVDRDGRRRRVVEEAALEMRERRLRGVAPAGGQLLDARAGESREILRGPPQRRERGTARLVRERHGHVGAPGERLEQRPTRRRSGPRSRTRRRARRARRRAPTAGARPPAGAGGRGPSAPSRSSSSR